MAKGSLRTEEKPCSVTIPLSSNKKLFGCHRALSNSPAEKDRSAPKSQRKGKKVLAGGQPNQSIPRLLPELLVPLRDPIRQKTLFFSGKAGKSLGKDNSIKAQYQTHSYSLYPALIVHICGLNATIFFLLQHYRFSVQFTGL